MADPIKQMARDDALIDQASERLGATAALVTTTVSGKGNTADTGLLILADMRVDTRRLISVDPPPMRWLVRERIQLGRGFLATGVGGSSKTRLMYHLAIGVAIGQLPWSWEVEQTGKSVLVLTEDTEEDVARTLHHMCDGLGLSQNDRQRVAQSVVLMPLAGFDIKLLAAENSRELIKTPYFTQLEQLVRDEGDVVFVGMDPALSLTSGDEMDQGHQRALGKMADDLAVRTGAAAALVSHATKGSLQQEELSSHASRGGGAITDAVRAEFAMRTMTSQEAVKAGISDLEERKRHVQLVATKGNHLPPCAYVPVWLRRGEYGVLLEAGVEMSGDGERPLTAMQQEVLDVLKEMCAVHVPTLADWRNQCVERGVIKQRPSDAATEQAMKRIVNALRTKGLITQGVGRGVWIPADWDQDT
jgi:hypothetical protein